jgi:tripartite-type tricarboxylate transporter receptor subunit TctC
MFVPGGTSDIVARVLQNPLSTALGQPIVIENRAGAGGITGTEALTRAAPDGHTLGVIISTHAANVALHPKLPFDAIKDISPVGLIGYVPNILVVNPSLPVRTFAELIALAKAKPGDVHFASSGNGTSQHFAGELLRLGTGAQLVHVPYRGAPPAMNDVISGQVQMMFGNFASILPHVQSGRVRALAVSGSERSALLPDLPTVAESGVPGFSVAEWFGVVGPAGVPAEIVTRVNEEIGKALVLPDVRKRLEELGMDVRGGSPQEFADLIKSDISKFKDLVERANIKPD